ncbi:MAG: PKD domain-containing protein, partial [Thermoplasmatales archaeon]|nr:PKD domain-containing protein [Thermoplasmatales archaeon]
YCSDSTLTVKWYLNVKVVDPINNAVQNATVRIEDNLNGTFDENYTTDQAGYVKWIECTEYYNQNETETTYYTPYNISVSKEGFDPNSTSIYINKSKEITIRLEDTSEPAITNIEAKPSPQEIDGEVNITCVVVDNVAVDTVKVNITDPEGGTRNETMNKTGNTYYCNKTYDIIGWYNYTIWANDTSNNWNNSGVYSFNITVALDTEPPQISIPPTASPDPQEVNNWVNITVYVSDNVGVSSVKVNVSYPNGTTLGNFSMTGVELDANGNGTYYYDTSYSETGGYSYFIWTKDSSNNENTTISSYTFTIQDTTKPTITNIQAIPEKQTSGGCVNISAVVTDQYLNKVYLNITYPNNYVMNISITENVTDSTYYCNQTYAPPGKYFYFIWANDSSENANVSETKTFNITDSTPPKILNISASPLLQSIGGYVNISVEITDNYMVSEVWLNISCRDSNYGNFSITQNVTGTTYYCNKSYTMVGEYSYFIWAKDTNNNENKSPIHGFEIRQEIIKPEISNVQSTPQTHEVYGYVNITVSVSDNARVNDVYVNITYPNGTQLGIFPMTGIELDANGNGTYHYNTTYSVLGNYSYYIWANDTSNNQNKSEEDYHFLIQDSASPTANAGQNKEVNEDVETEMNASLSWDNVEIVNWTWSFMDQGEEVFLYGEIVHYPFTQPGSYVITLNVSDSTGNWAVDVLNITVKDITPPVITILSPVDNTITNQNLTLIFFVSDNVDDRDNITVNILNGTIYSNEGVYPITINVSDRAGNSVEETITFTIDKTKPVLEIISPENNTITNQDVMLTYSLSDNFDDPDSITVNILNETVYSGERSYNVTINATDRAGNTASASVFFVIDKTPPGITITNVANDSYYNTNITPTVDITDANLDTNLTTLNGNPFISGTIIIAEGNYTLFVQATDKADNTASRTITFTIDKTKPTVNVAGVIDGIYYNVSVTPTFWGSDINLDTVSATLNDEIFTNNTPVQDEGSYTLSVQVTDKARNNAIKTISFTIDKTLPCVNVTNIKDGVRTSESSILVRGEVDDLNATVKINGVNAVREGKEFWDKIKLVEGKNTIVIVAEDTAGNKNSTTIIVYREKGPIKIDPYWLILTGAIILLVVFVLYEHLRKKKGGVERTTPLEEKVASDHPPGFNAGRRKE